MYGAMLPLGQEDRAQRDLHRSQETMRIGCRKRGAQPFFKKPVESRCEAHALKATLDAIQLKEKTLDQTTNSDESNDRGKNVLRVHGTAKRLPGLVQYCHTLSVKSENGTQRAWMICR
jgi:hypothetical protein